MSFDSSRRELLKKAAAAMVFSGLPRELRELQEGEELVDFADLENFRIEPRSELPRVKLFDLRRLTSIHTPQAEFFEFHQTETQTVEAAAWKLRVTGAVDKPREYTLDEIKARSDRRDLSVTIECSGNTPVNAANGQVSTGLWTGVGLASILRECVVKPEAREVVFFGMDRERERNATIDTVHGRSVYVQDALDPNAILAFAMNGEALSPGHGFPLRVILPGWYGMTQIKWLGEIRVLDRRYEGAHMSRNYHTVRAIPTAEGGEIFETSISRNRLKSVVARVTRQQAATGSYRYKVFGAAWGGPSPIRSVELRVDGKPWIPVKLGERQGGHSWVLWTFDWDDATTGPHGLVSRAVDEAGNLQPSVEEFRETQRTAREDNSQWLRRIVIK